MWAHITEMAVCMHSADPLSCHMLRLPNRVECLAFLSQPLRGYQIRMVITLRKDLFFVGLVPDTSLVQSGDATWSLDPASCIKPGVELSHR
jgi:hypothetical protein